MRNILNLVYAGILILSLSFVFNSCNNKDTKAQDFVSEFTRLVSEQKTDSVHILYPASVCCDSFVNVGFLHSDSVKIENPEASQFSVMLCDSINITINRKGEDGFEVISSKGLFAYKKQTIEDAKKTGQYKHGLIDTELHMRLNDSSFVAYLDKLRAKAANPLSLTIAQTKEWENNVFNPGEQTVKVHNNSNMTVKGNEYKIAFIEEYMPTMSRRNSSIKGSDISPNGYMKEKFWFNMYSGCYNFRIVYLKSAKERAEKYYKYTGKEYEEFLKIKAETEQKTKSAGKLGASGTRK